MRAAHEAGHQSDQCAMRRRTVLAGACVAVAGTAVVSTAAGCSATNDPAASVDDEGLLGALADVPVGGGAVFTRQAVVVTQPSAGDLRAFSAVCPHQGCLVNQVDDGTINCPCHGSRFSASDGSVVQGPAQDPLEGRSVVVDGDDIRLA